MDILLFSLILVLVIILSYIIMIVILINKLKDFDKIVNFKSQQK